MIKYQLNANVSDESDDEAEIARLEAKYLKKRRWYKLIKYQCSMRICQPLTAS
jgi:hypothetical protein